MPQFDYKSANCNCRTTQMLRIKLGPTANFERDNHIEKKWVIYDKAKQMVHSSKASSLGLKWAHIDETNKSHEWCN